MALMDFIKKQLIEIIEWQDDSRDTLSYRWPDQDKEIKNNAQLIVRESQVAQFVYLGKYADALGPGKHTLTTENIPVLSTILGWKYGFESPFKADVYYVTTRVFAGNKWGTANPIMMRDADFGVVRMRAFGQYDFKIVNPSLFLKEVAGTDNHFRLDEFADVMRSKIVTVFTEAIAAAKVPALDVASRYTEIGEALLPAINPLTTSKYGIEITSFNIENVSLPPEVEQAIDKRGAMTTIGDMGDYIKYNMANAVAEGKAGTMGFGAEFAVAMGVGQQMANQGAVGVNPNAPKGMVPGAMAAPAAAAAAAVAPVASAAPMIELMNPAQVAQALGVTEADVLTELDAGNLKGRKIGTQWRVTRDAVDTFLKG
ncbi:MAG: helix-turn-helix domain-containing protein [Betaproteobacteria bacterium]|nr:MAG: helix-turn-helix domain-containing protein [Betaproteobacteria bacterium]TAG45996.1 MAG: helix-turn-helix domain-containing protein [Betaproteobacteria bacterium]